MSKTGLVLLFGALIAGGAIGYVAGSAGSEPTSIPVEDGSRPTPDRPRETWEPAGGERSSSGGASLADLLADFETGDDVKPGTGVITGRVETEEGMPLADVVLRAEAIVERHYARDMSGAPPEEKDLVKHVEEMVKDRHRKLSARREARTGRDGRFEIEGLTDSKYRLMAYLRGWQMSPKPGTRTYNMKAGETADFIARPMVGLPVTIVMPDGTEATKGWLSVKGDRRPRSHAWSPEFPTIYLKPGDYEVQAIAGEHRELKSDEVEVSFAAGDAPSAITLAVVEKPGIKGTITFPKGMAQAYGQICALPVIAGQEPDTERLSGAQKRAWVYPGRKEYVIPDLAPGTWLVGFVLQNQKVLEHRTVEIAGAMITIDFELPAPSADECVIVRVETPDGKLLKTARVSAGYSGEGDSVYFGGMGATQLEDGSWQVPHYTRPDFQPVAGGAYIVQAWSEKYGQKRVEYDKESQGSVTIRFDEPASVIVTLTGYKGTVYQGATRIGLTAKEKGSSRAGGMGVPYFNPYGGGSGTPDAEGVQKISPLSPGEYELRVYLHGKGWNQHVVHKEPVTVKEGENRVTVPLPPLYDLVVTVAEPVDGKKRTYTLTPLKGSQPGQAFRPTVKGLTVEFRSIPAGEYVFTVSGGRQNEKMVVSVPGPAVRFAPQVFNAQLVEIEDPDGGLAMAGLKSGDLVIGVDGAEFKDEAHLQARWIEASAKETAKLLVLRGAKRLEIVADLTKLKGPGSGGSLKNTTR